MPSANWAIVTTVLAMAQEYGLVAYLDGILADIDNQLAEQEH